MKRRTFLKTLGAAMAATVTPVSGLVQGYNFIPFNRKYKTEIQKALTLPRGFRIRNMGKVIVVDCDGQQFECLRFIVSGRVYGRELESVCEIDWDLLNLISSDPKEAIMWELAPHIESINMMIEERKHWYERIR